MKLLTVKVYSKTQNPGIIELIFTFCICVLLPFKTMASFIACTSVKWVLTISSTLFRASPCGYFTTQRGKNCRHPKIRNTSVSIADLSVHFVRVVKVHKRHPKRLKKHFMLRYPVNLGLLFNPKLLSNKGRFKIKVNIFFSFYLIYMFSCFFFVRETFRC